MVLSRWAHWNVFYLGIRFVLSPLHFCPKHLSLERITFDKGWFFEITQRIARGASPPSVPSLWCCPEFRVSRRSPRRPPLLEMEMCPCWGLGVRGVEWCHQRESFCRTQRQQTMRLSFTSEWEWGHRMSLSVNDCIKGRRKPPLVLSWKCAHAAKESLSGSLCCRQRTVSAGQACGSQRGESRCFPLSHIGGCLLSPHGHKAS